MACGNLLVAGLLRVNLTVSPSVTRTTGPGTCPLNVQAAYFSPLPSMITSVSTAVIDTSGFLATARVDGIVWLMNVIVASLVEKIRLRNNRLINMDCLLFEIDRN